MAANQAVTAPPAADYKRARDVIYLSGQVGVNADWEPVNDTFKDEARQVFRNVARVLEDAGASLSDVVYVRTYLSDFSDFAAFNEVWLEIFSDNPPARATIQAGLHPPFRVEAEVTAYMPAIQETGTPSRSRQHQPLGALDTASEAQGRE